MDSSPTIPILLNSFYISKAPKYDIYYKVIQGNVFLLPHNRAKYTYQCNCWHVFCSCFVAVSRPVPTTIG